MSKSHYTFDGAVNTIAKMRIAKSYEQSEQDKMMNLVSTATDKLNDNFNKGFIDINVCEKAFTQLDGVIQKARQTKYLKRTGMPGHYKYEYSEEAEKQASSQRATNANVQKPSHPKWEDFKKIHNDPNDGRNVRDVYNQAVESFVVDQMKNEGVRYPLSDVTNRPEFEKRYDKYNRLGFESSMTSDQHSEAANEIARRSKATNSNVDDDEHFYHVKQAALKERYDVDKINEQTGGSFTLDEIANVIGNLTVNGVEDKDFILEKQTNILADMDAADERAEELTAHINHDNHNTLSNLDIKDIIYGYIMVSNHNQDNYQLASAERQAKEQSMDGFVQHVERNENGGYRVSDWYDSDNTVSSFENGFKKSSDQLDIIKSCTEEEDQLMHLSVFDVMKAGKAGLIARKVQIKKKDGSVYMATRYFSQEDIDEMKDSKSDEDVSNETSNEIDKILSTEKSKAGQLRRLIDIGIHNPMHLMAMSSEFSESNVKHYLKEAGISPKSFDIMAPRPAAKVSESGEITYETSEDDVDVDELEQEIEALLRADGIYFGDEDLNKPNAHTGKDAVDTVQDKFTNMVAKGQSKLAMFYGTGGVGKTWGVKQVLQKPSVKDEFGHEFGNELVEYDSELQPTKEQYDFIKFTGKITPTKLYRALYEHNGKVIMLDDCDSVLMDEDSVNILKAATDTTLEDVVWDGQSIKPSNAEGKDAPPLPTRFKFRGGIIFISNLAESKIREKAGPLLDSRALSLDITRTKEETIDKLNRIKDYMDFEDTNGNSIQVSNEARKAAIEFVRTYSKHCDVSVINARTFGSLAKDFENTKYPTQMDFMKSHSARSIMNVLDHQMKTYHIERKKEEAKQAKEKRYLMTSIHQHLK